MDFSLIVLTIGLVVGIGILFVKGLIQYYNDIVNGDITIR